MIFYVATNGNNQNDGTAKAPFATVERARDAVRGVIREGLSEPVTVRIREGVYHTCGLRLEACDGGTARFPVTYEAEGEVTLNGGVALDGGAFEPLSQAERARLHGDAADRVVRLDLKTIGLCREDFGEMCVIGSHHTGDRYDGAVLSPMWCELFVDGRRQTVARYPNEGFLHTTSPIREGDGLESTITGKVTYRYTLEEWETVRNPRSDIFGIDADTARRAAAWKSLRDVWMFGYPTWHWASASTPIVRIDGEACEMETKMVARYGIKPNRPFYFYNVLEELDAPGEWYLDRQTGVLYLYPDRPLAGADINLSLLSESVLTVDGADYVTFRGITFTGTRADALTLTGNHLTIEGCAVKNVSGNAMIVKGNHNRVSGCEICHTGRGGVFLCGGDRATLMPSYNIAENNHVHHFAEIVTTYQPAFSLEGVGNICRHNRIHDCPHMAIYFMGNEHLIEYNEISDVCKTADDSSAIYSGRDYTTQGTVIRHNYFHDIHSEVGRGVGIFAVYCDDHLGSCTIVGNVFVRCQSALLLHGGHDMTFRGNLILASAPASDNSVFFSKYQYWDDLLPGGLHAKRLAEVPWQGEIWQNAYPRIAQYLSWDPETEQRYPHGVDISGNVVIDHKPFRINFAWDDPRFGNRMENNLFFDELFDGDLARLCEELLPETVTGFTAIPFGKIGILH